MNALYSLVSFATSEIYLAFFLNVFGAFVARCRGWRPSGLFTGKVGMTITIGGGVYLLLIIVWLGSLSGG